MPNPLRIVLLLFALAPTLTRVPAAEAPASPAGRQAPAAFTGSVVITTDPEWRKKWGTPADTTPQVAQADVVKRGQKLWALVFFSAPKLDATGKVNVVCDLRFVKPDGKTALDQKGVACFRGPLIGDARKVRLASQSIEFVGDPSDPTGTWRIQVTLRDMNARAELPLFAVFTLRE